jgi:hypothetical protein
LRSLRRRGCWRLHLADIEPRHGLTACLRRRGGLLPVGDVTLTKITNLGDLCDRIGRLRRGLNRRSASRCLDSSRMRTSP